MTIENLRCFTILAQELNFTRAAKKAHITQTAMSRKITSIENELSVSLFTRDRHQVALTSAGQEFYNHILPVLENYSFAVQQAQNVDKGLRDSIQIGVGVYEHELLRPVMKDFAQRYPLPKINCVQHKYRKLLEEFEHRRLDIIVTSDQFLHTVPQEELEAILLHDAPWVLAVNRKNPLAQEDPVEMSELEKQNIITMNEGNINVVRTIFRRYFPLSTIDYVNSYETKMMLVSAERGVAFIPSFVDISPYPEVVTRRLSPLYRPRKYYAVIKRDNINPYAHYLVHMLEEYYQRFLWLQELPR